MILNNKVATLSVWRKIFLVLFLTSLVFVIGRIPGHVNGQVLPASNLDQKGVAVSSPARIKIQTLGVDAPVVKLGLNANRTLAVPKGDWEVGWYVGSPPPGALGPSVMVGHLDSARGPAVFQNLSQLKKGDTIQVVRQDGIIVNFKVDSIEKYSQSQFPTEKVYGATNAPTLRLITCAGTYSRLKGRYSDNLVVYASLK